MYLEESVLEKKILDMDLRILVEMPNGIDYNEWLASHSKFKKMFVCHDLLSNNIQNFYLFL